MVTADKDEWFIVRGCVEADLEVNQWKDMVSNVVQMFLCRLPSVHCPKTPYLSSVSLTRFPSHLFKQSTLHGEQPAQSLSDIRTLQ